jgi:sugar/nucleoside kinase (ribokinase family)
MSRLDLFSIGSWTIFDHILRLARLPANGETVPLDMPVGEIDAVHYGDCSANIAAVAARLGLSSGLGMVVGDDFDTSGYRAHLAALGVDLAGVEVRAGARSGHSYNFFDRDNGSFCVSHLGVAAEQGDFRAPLDLIAQSRALVVSEMFSPYTLGAIEFARANGVLTAINGMVATAGEQATRFLAATEILFLSRGEARALLDAQGVASPGDLLALGPRLVVVTEGSVGSLWHDAAGVVRVPAVATSAFVDSTGAGDSFVAGALFGLLRGAGAAEAGRIAATVASFVVEAWGCQTNLPTAARMRERYRAAFGDLPTP